MTTITMRRRRVQALYNEQVARWRSAWISFWEDAFSALTDCELDLMRHIPFVEEADWVEERLTSEAPRSLEGWSDWDIAGEYGDEFEDPA